jgi:hypothetical protein
MKFVKIVGGLGSQMLAYSLSIALSEKYGQKVIADFSSYEYASPHNGYELGHIFNIKEDKINKFLSIFLNSTFFPIRIFRKIASTLRIIKYYDAEKNKYNFDPEVFNQTGNVIYRQCWTSYKYFLGIESVIKEVFQFPEIDEKNLSVYYLIKNTNSISIHVRRGDYVNHKILGELASIYYYDKAITCISSMVINPTFFIFSNDIDWCKEKIKISNAHFINWNIGKNSFRDMQLMSVCKHNIIPNSSFSWWGAYLNKNPFKIVVAPSRWINPSEDHEMKDMNLPSWIVIDNF